MNSKELSRWAKKYEKIKSVEACKAALKDIAGKPLFLPSVRLNKGTKFYRIILDQNLISQNENGLFDKKIDQKFFSYPPLDIENKIGRCNTIGNSVFYAAWDIDTAYIEQKEQAETGTIFRGAEWMVTNPFYIIPLGFTPDEGKRIGLYKNDQNTFRSYGEMSKIFHMFLRKWFQEPSDKYYPQTIAISEWFMATRCPDEYGGRLVGIAYMSVQHPSKEKIPFNLCFSTTIADECISMIGAEYQKVIEINNEEVVVQKIAGSNTFENMKIHWPDSEQLRIRINSENPSVTVKIENDQYVITDDKGRKKHVKSSVRRFRFSD